jgi:aspartyl-tRNA(Asn)/glutamyl-tRNA(Gln) amidotransferase subunit A
MADVLTSLTIAEAADLMRTKKLSPVELTQAHLDRIEKIDPLLNSYITVTSEMALEQARTAEAEIMRGGYWSLLQGIPLAYKDLFHIYGVPTTAGSKFPIERHPHDYASAVAWLPNSERAIVLGKTNMHEWAFGVINDNPHFGACRNPWDTTRSPGGSSGGSAAALAAELCMGAMGSDTRGSIRIPAALCGIVGLKPTQGRVSVKSAIPLSWSLDHVGPMARTVKDVAILLQKIAGYDAHDPASVNVPVYDYFKEIGEGVKGWKIGWVSDELFDSADVEIRDAVKAARDVFSHLEADMKQIMSVPHHPSLFDTRESSRVISSVDAAAYHRERIEKEPEKFGADVLKRLKEGLSYTGIEYALARRERMKLFSRVNNLLRNVGTDSSGYDILLIPTTPMTAPRLDDPAELDRARTSLSWFTAPFNMAGVPAISIPCGFTSDGLPIGLQLVAAPWQEAKLLRAAYAYEQATEWHKRRPLLD